MLKILVTRFGGFGDLLMIEPTLEALYYKHSPCEITVRTSPVYSSFFSFHPLVKNIIIDDAHYIQTRGVCPTGYDYYYNFQGTIEKQFGLHGIDTFVAQTQIPIMRRTPSVFIDPKTQLTKTEEVVLQLKSNDPDRNLNNLDTKNYYQLSYGSGLTTHQYLSTIENSRVFMGVDSSGLHIAAALGVPQIVGIYLDKYPPIIRQYPRMLTANLNDLPDIQRKFQIALDMPTYPEYLKQKDAGKAFIANKALIYCKGIGYDIGSEHPLPGSLPITDANRKRMMPFVDYVFSSHILQQVQDWEQEIKQYENVVRTGGYLFLYLPHPRMEMWRPGGAWGGENKRTINPVLLAKYLIENTSFKMIEYTSQPDMFWSFYMVMQKK